MKVVLFAQCRQAAGRDHCELPASAPLSQGEFWDLLLADFPELAPFQKSARLARHESYLQAGELLQPEDEIAVIPPVSGG